MEELNKGDSLYTLKPSKIAVHTVNGTCENNYKRRKIKIRTSKGVIRNYNSIVVNKIGREEAKTKDYVQLIVDLFQMKQEHKEYILSKIAKESMEITLILGVRAQESMLSNIRAEQLGYINPWELPNVSI